MHRWPTCRSRIAVQLPAGRDVGIGSTATGFPERVHPQALAALIGRDVHFYCGTRPEVLSQAVISGTAQNPQRAPTELVFVNDDARVSRPRTESSALRHTHLTVVPSVGLAHRGHRKRWP